MANETNSAKATIILNNNDKVSLVASGKESVDSSLKAISSTARAVETIASTAESFAKAGEYYARIAECNAATAYLESQIENKAKVKALIEQHGLTEEEAKELLS